MSALSPFPDLDFKRSAPEKLYYRPSEIAKATGLSKATVFDALWAGQLKGYRVGKAWLIPVEAVHEWIRGEDQVAA